MRWFFLLLLMGGKLLYTFRPTAAVVSFFWFLRLGRLLAG
jgi:hypothetical protein